MAKKMYVGVKENLSNTLLLLHGAAISDNSSFAHVITNHGVTASSAQSKFGGTSLYFDGSSYLSIKTADFMIANGNFTIDWWQYRQNTGTIGCFNVLNETGYSQFLIQHGDGTKLYGSYTGTGWDAVSGVAAFTLTQNAWVHCAIVKNGTTLTTYQNGAKVWSGTVSNAFADGTGELLIGCHAAASNRYYFQGYIDEFRISNVARWTAAFSVPTAQHTADASFGDSFAREVKKGYIGVSGVARKIKKGYIGVSGVARPFWTGGELAYYGTATALRTAKTYLAATTVGNYALFGGGYGLDASAGYVTHISQVDAYNTSLTRSTPTDLTAMSNHAATTVGNYALFGGGTRSNGVSNLVYAYNTSLTRSTPTALSSKRAVPAATTVGNYALFGGGGTSRNEGASLTVDAYNGSLTRSAPTQFVNYYGLSRASATTVGNYALFGAGRSVKYPAKVYAYNESLTQSTATALSVDRYDAAATTVGDYALFGGGYQDSSSTLTAAVDAYNKSLTRSTPTALSAARYGPSATSVGGFAVFGGGMIHNGSAFVKSNVVDVYDASLTRTIGTPLSTAREFLVATTVGNYALFGGGGNPNAGSNGGLHNVVDVYTAS